MKRIVVGAGELNQTPMDWVGNKHNILDAIHEASRKGVGLLCLPELCLTGYGCGDRFTSPDLQRRAWRFLTAIANEMPEGIYATVGLPVRFNNAIFNGTALISHRKIHGIRCKMKLAGDGIHYEDRWFTAWQPGVMATLKTDVGDLPIGDIFFAIAGIKVGFEVCEEAWGAERPGAKLAANGVDIILNPSASHFAFGKVVIRRRWVEEGSRAFGAAYVLANLLGLEADRAIFDGGGMVATEGHLVAAGPRMRFDPVRVTTAVIDVEANRRGQMRTASFAPALTNASNCIPITQPIPEMKGDSLRNSRFRLEAWETSADVKHEEFYRAMTLALFDYSRKCKSNGFVVSLSGGADSAACASFVYLMVGRILDEQGSNFLSRAYPGAKLPSVQDTTGLSRKQYPRAYVRSLLTTAYQATKNSGDVTKHAAAILAEALGSEHHELYVEPIHGEYVRLVEHALGRPLTWETDDLTLQNIQARVRAPSIWMFANIKNALLLATSNRNEADVGYASMDGDTAGSLSPIAGVDKPYVRAFLKWLEEMGPEATLSDPGSHYRIPAMASVNVQQPTAELRPGATQTDEDDLMPYDVLTAIELAAIRDLKAPVEVLQTVMPEFHYSRAQMAAWVDRFFRLWCRNQWKRERYAIAFHFDDLNVDPKSWCRFPALSGGFDMELEELKAYVSRADAGLDTSSVEA